MATVQECEAAFDALAEKLSGADDGTRKRVDFNRSISCRLRDLDVTFLGRLRDGGLHDIREAPHSDAQVRLTMASDDLLALTAGRLSLAAAWASGRVQVHASIFDLLRLRTLL